MSGKYTKAPELTAEKAYKLYNDDGLSYTQIAEQFSDDDESITHTTVRNRVQAYDSGRESGVEEVTSNPESYDLKSAIEDEPDDNNPYETVECPNCGGETSKPDTEGNHVTDCCSTTLKWSSDEI